PLDPSYPSQRLQELMRDAGPGGIVWDRVGRGALGPAATGATAILALDDGVTGLGLESDPDVPGLSSSHLASVIYPSGSTGTPKGVQNQHRGIVNRLTWMQSAYRIDASDVVLQKTPYGF